ncbi:MAG: peptidase MA domain-containing protein [Dehalococcoidales bacterium]|nr:peptidase MA domain-containing protein [Dehalococcoidales bacterium]
MQVSYPSSITFEVQAQSDADIASLRLHYVTGYQNIADVVSEGWAKFVPAKSVDTRWVWDMRQTGSLPPGTRIDYWWTAVDTAGNIVKTERTSVSFDDDTHVWKSLTEGPVTLLWYKGDQEFADTLMSYARDGLDKIESDLGLEPDGQVRIYIYGSVQEMQASRLFPQQWEAGVNYGGYNVIALGVAPGDLEFAERAIPHELTHWVVGNFISNSYGAGLPTWLDEGLATYMEEGSYSFWLDFAIQQNMLLSVRTISSPFSAVDIQAYISYAESHSIVTYLLETYGKDKMRRLLEVFQKGSGYDDALEQVYDFDQDGLHELWLESLGVRTSSIFPLPAPVTPVAA